MVFENDLNNIKTETERQSPDYTKVISDLDSLIAKIDAEINDPLEAGESVLDWLQNERNPGRKGWKLTKLSLEHAKRHSETVRSRSTQIQSDRITRALDSITKI